MSCTTVKARPGSDGSSTSSFPNSERQLGPLREYRPVIFYITQIPFGLHADQ